MDIYLFNEWIKLIMVDMVVYSVKLYFNGIKGELDTKSIVSALYREKAIKCSTGKAGSNELFYHFPVRLTLCTLSFVKLV